MPFIYVDRRKAGKGKSSTNRQKLLKRIRGFIKQSSPQSLGAGGVAQVYSSGKAANNPVKIAANALEEPWFAYGKSRENFYVFPGNTEYDRGDTFELPEEDGAAAGGGPGPAGEDDFVINIASNEFLELFFEDCVLPNLDSEKTSEKQETKMAHAGFATQGNASQLSIIRTYKQALGRRNALAGPYQRELNDLEQEMKAIYERSTEEGLTDKMSLRLSEIETRIGVLRSKIAVASGFDKVDLRFRKKEPQALKQVDALLVMVMDVSGSMGHEEKTIARRWFALLFAFIKRRYANTDLVFIAHTDEAFEMNEGDFFSTRINGGTAVSPALEKINAIIRERYDPSHTNIYISHASDGDNWETDNESVMKEMTGTAGLLHKIQYFSYVEVGKSKNWSFKPSTNLWDSYLEAHNTAPEKMSMAVIEEADACYDIFKKLFKKKQ
jgi:uncharacterized sporulation protein YeaH/YhbH (DUF444 family)